MEVVLYEQENQVEGHRVTAEDNFMLQQTDNALYAKRKVVEGILSLAEVQSKLLCMILEAFDENYMVMRDFLMIDSGLYKEMTRINTLNFSSSEINLFLFVNLQSSDQVERLSQCFDKLMADVTRSLESKNRDKFTQNLTIFRHEFRVK
ncbi:hypothetical protein ZIOFF_015690 [Zingiber officinale]|uniref:Uncharacterized protein n=1 Tax=Zingiber officinale TaxID=94328 RepID=A0A8J5I0N7_ZINOF|nr:hypothetical protein ZIOFF_015690 [Zingiber officinale]